MMVAQLADANDPTEQTSWRSWHIRQASSLGSQQVAFPLPIEDEGFESKPLKLHTNFRVGVSGGESKPLLSRSRSLCFFVFAPRRNFAIHVRLSVSFCSMRFQSYNSNSSATMWTRCVRRYPSYIATRPLGLATDVELSELARLRCRTRVIKDFLACILDAIDAWSDAWFCLIRPCAHAVPYVCFNCHAFFLAELHMHPANIVLLPLEVLSPN